VTERVFTVAPGVDVFGDEWEGSRRPWFLLVHGLASNRRLWHGVARHLSEAGFSALAIDLRGHGSSSKPDGGYRVADVAADVAAVVEQLAATGRGRAVVAGQSWGGNVVLETARSRPEILAGVVAVDGGWIHLARSFPSWEACAAELAPGGFAGRPAAEVESELRGMAEGWPDDAVDAFMANFEVTADGTIAPWLSFDHHMAVLEGLWGDDPAARYPHVEVPTLLLPAYGHEASWDTEKRAAVDEAAAAIPHALVRGFQADHDVHLQHPDLVAQSMIQAVESGFFR
jgi:pimeloyl-ACP methyl ester carboxylesterase